jgi:hypothetical protein
MNKIFREFERESKLEIFGLGARRDVWEKALEKYAELIVGECMECADIVGKSNLTSGYPNSTAHHIKQKIREHFGVEESKGWVCTKCGVDRTKVVCPLGHSAAITGDCPMTGEAQWTTEN